MLTIDHLSAGYGKLQILHDVDLVVPAQRFVAILGPNGSGKSTLLKSIFGLTDIFGGAVKLAGVSLLGLPTERIGEQGISYVPQRANVFTSMSVAENLQLASRRLVHSAQLRTFDELYQLFPILADRQQQRAGQLSGGERQMLAIAMGWLMQPRVMLLDEPSAGLSPLFVTEVFRTLRQLCERGVTLAVVEQNARSVLRWCDSAYVLREGRVVFHGDAEELRGDEELVKSYLGLGLRQPLAAPI